eukprot:6176958-Pleurochrysis_carterae.AAC.3
MSDFDVSLSYACDCDASVGEAVREYIARYLSGTWIIERAAELVLLDGYATGASDPFGRR